MWILWKALSDSTEVLHRWGKVFSNFNKEEREFKNTVFAG